MNLPRSARRSALALVAAALLAAWLGTPVPGEAADAALVRYLRSGPRDAKKLQALLQRALKAKRYEEACLVAHQLYRIGVRGPKLVRLLGLLAHRTGKKKTALAALREAYRLDPRDRAVQRALTALEPTGVAGFRMPDPRPAIPTTRPPVPDPIGPETSPALREAFTAFFQDRYDRALGLIEEALEADPGEMEALVLKARILQQQMKFDQAGEILAKLAEDHPGSGRVRTRLAEYYANVASSLPLENEKRQELVGRAYLQFQESVKLEPGSPTGQMLFATFLYSLQTPESRSEAESHYAHAVSHRPFRDRELALADAMIQFIRGEQDRAFSQLETYNKDFGTDSQSLLLEGMLLMRKGDHARAGESLEHSFRRNSSNLNLALQVSSMLVTVDQADRALKIIGLVEAEFPLDPRLEEMKSQLKLRVVTDRDFVTSQVGVFEMVYPKMLRSYDARAFQAIERTYEESFQELGEVMSFRPNHVRVKIHYQTGIDNPAFYNLSDDSITISAKFFIQPREEHRDENDDPVAREAMRTFALHMIRHEYAHLVFAHRVGREKIKDAKQTLPLWLLEGVAEWASGGIGDIPQSGPDLAKLFENGPLDHDELNRSMSVFNATKDAQINLKAYVQSYYMVKTLMAGEKDEKAAMDRFIEFSGALLATGKLGEALTRVYSMDLAAFDAAWREQIRKDLLENDDPVRESPMARRFSDAPIPDATLPDADPEPAGGPTPSDLASSP